MEKFEEQTLYSFESPAGVRFAAERNKPFCLAQVVVGRHGVSANFSTIHCLTISPRPSD
jgi:hypothetical protein